MHVQKEFKPELSHPFVSYHVQSAQDTLSDRSHCVTYTRSKKKVKSQVKFSVEFINQKEANLPALPSLIWQDLDHLAFLHPLNCPNSFASLCIQDPIGILVVHARDFQFKFNKALRFYYADDSNWLIDLVVFFGRLAVQKCSPGWFPTMLFTQSICLLNWADQSVWPGGEFEFSVKNFDLKMQSF